MHGRLLPLMLVSLLAACDDVSAPLGTNSDSVGRGRPGVRLVLGSGSIDTVDATPLAALVVEVFDSTGRAAVGTAVRFTSIPVDSNRPYTFQALVAEANQADFRTFAAPLVDARGRAAAVVRLGTVSGTARVVITVPEFAWRDTARFTVRPGNAVGVQALPEDTALYVGATFTARAAVVDRYGNPRADSITFLPTPGFITISPGGQINATGIGRARYLVRGAGKTDTGWVSVVPQGVLAAYRSPDYGVPGGIVTFGLDGSNLQLVSSVTGGYYDVNPRWTPGGTRLIFTAGGYSAGRLIVTDLEGNANRLIDPPPPGLEEEIWGNPSQDGFVYFSGRSTSFQLWRSAANGTGAALLYADPSGIAWRPSPSPDGTQVAFIRAGGPGGAEIKVLTVGSGGLAAWAAVGQTPRWSPNGQAIAYTTISGGPLRVMDSDGTDARVVTPGSRYSESPFDWSPDSQWLVARGETRLEVINVASGLALPLGYSTGLTNPAWRP